MGDQEPKRALTIEEQLAEIQKLKEKIRQNGASPEVKKILSAPDGQLPSVLRELGMDHDEPDPRITFKDNRLGHENGTVRK